MRAPKARAKIVNEIIKTSLIIQIYFQGNQTNCASMKSITFSILFIFFLYQFLILKTVYLYHTIDCMHVIELIGASYA